MDKELKKLIEAIEAAGYVVTVSSKGHPIVSTKSGERITTLSGTPSDRRSWLNGLAPLKRRGFRWPPR